MKQFYKPRVVMSIHGYVSKGKWQDLLSKCIEEEENLTSVPYKYGFKLLRVLPHHIRNDVKKFRDWYFSITDSSPFGLKISEPFHRPSIIAHSLGTWIVAKALMTYPEIKFDKIFLFGSIIPEDFDWFKLILNDQVSSVIYEKTDRDKVVPWGFIFTGSTKGCGVNGFIQRSSFLREENFSHFGHSTFNYKAHFREFIIKRLNQTPHQLSAVAGRQLSEKAVLKYFKNTSKIDQIIYPADYTTDPIPMERVMEWFRIEKDIWSFVINSYNGEAIGYINAIPVKEEMYKKFCSGEISEKDIKGSEVQDYDTISSYNLIVLSIAIRKSFNGEETMLTKGRIAEMLIMSFIYKINQHNNGANKLKKMAAFAWTQEGQKLCQGFCMTRNEEYNSPFPLYELDFTKLTHDKIQEGNFMSKWWYKELLNQGSYYIP